MAKSKTKKTAELEDLQVLMISIVGKGANKKKIVYKSKDKKEGNIEKLVKVKFDNEKGIAYGIVYSPDEIDAHDEWASADTIEKACHEFMKRSNMKAIDTDHSLEIADGCFIVESWIVKEGDSLFPEDVGAWAIAIKIEDEDIKKGIKDGTYTGFSLYGFAKTIEGSEPTKEKSEKPKVKSDGDNEEEKTVLEKIKGSIGSLMNIINGGDTYKKLEKSFKENLTRYNMNAVLDAFSSSFWDIRWNNEDIETQKEQLKKLTDEVKQAIEDIEIAKSVTEDDDDAVEKLQKGVEAFKVIKKFLELNKPDDTGNQEGDSEMTKEEIQSMVDEAVEKKTEDLTKKNDDLEKKNTELQKKIKKLEKKTKGSAQDDDIDDNEDGKKKEKKKVFSYMTGDGDYTGSAKSKKEDPDDDDDDDDDEEDDD